MYPLVQVEDLCPSACPPDTICTAKYRHVICTPIEEPTAAALIDTSPISTTALPLITSTAAALTDTSPTNSALIDTTPKTTDNQVTTSAVHAVTSGTAWTATPLSIGLGT